MSGRTVGVGSLRIVGARSRGKTVRVAQENARELADTSNTLRGAGYDVPEALSLIRPGGSYQNIGPTSSSRTSD